MANHSFRPDPTTSRRSQRGATLTWVFFGFLAVAGFFFFTEHRAHLMGALPFLLLALCPLMHFFHGGHGGPGGHQGHGPTGSGSVDPVDKTGLQGSPDATPPPAASHQPHQH